MKIIYKIVPYLKRILIISFIVVVIWSIIAWNLLCWGDNHIANYVEKCWESVDKPANKEFTYFILSKEYKEEISLWEYMASDDEDILALYRKIDAVEPTEDYSDSYIINSNQSKKTIKDVLIIDGKSYIMRHNIDFKVNKWGTWIEIVNWEISIPDIE